MGAEEVMHSRQLEQHAKRLNDRRSRALYLGCNKHCNLAGETVRVGEGEVGGKVWLFMQGL